MGIDILEGTLEISIKTSLGSYIWHTFKLSVFSLAYVQCTGEPIKGILSFFYSIFLKISFWFFFRVSISAYITHLFRRVLSILIMVILNSNTSAILNLILLLLCFSVSVLFLTFNMAFNFLLKPDKIYWVIVIDLNRPLVRGFMLIWLGVWLSLMFAVTVDICGLNFLSYSCCLFVFFSLVIFGFPWKLLLK